MKSGNIYLSDDIKEFNEELFFDLYKNENTQIEKIISSGQATDVGVWLEENKDEFVILLQGESVLIFDDGSEIKLTKGDYLIIPAGRKHRVQYTTTNPKCIWLAIHLTKK